MSPHYTALSARTLGRFAWRMLASFILLVMLWGAGGDVAGSDKPRGRFVSYLYPFLFTLTVLAIGLAALSHSNDVLSAGGFYAAVVVAMFLGLVFLALGLRAITADLNTGR